MNTIQTICVKNMCCSRCITVIKDEMKRLGVDVVKAEIGEIKVCLNQASILQVQEALLKHDMDIIQDKETVMVAQIKKMLHDHVQNNSQNVPKKMSRHLSEKLGCNYSHLSRLFAQMENITIERYFILLKIEKVKELLEYNEHSLTEIAKMLSYSSTHHLSKQFKSVTGLSVSEYKKFMQVKRKPLDRL